MATTWSFKLLALTWMFRRTARVSLRMCFDIGLEFQPRFPGRRGQGFHPSVVHVTAAIEHHLFDPGSAGALSNFFSDHFGGRHVASALELLARVLVERTRRCERSPAAVIDDLRVNMTIRAVHAKTRPLGRSRYARPHAKVNPLTVRVAREFPDWFCCHEFA